VTATQLTTLLTFYSCNNNHPEDGSNSGRIDSKNIVNTIHHKHWSAFCWLFIYYGSD